ncbi:MAG: LemA family protein [Hyphomonadaceae bacterium]
MIWIVLLGLIGWFAIIYNNLRGLSESVKNFRSNILIASRKRADLAQRIADVAKSYADHEKLTHQAVNMSISNMTDSQKANQEATSIMGQVNALAQAYPDLKANQTFSQLMSQWEGLENDMQEARQQYNASATSYNAYQGSLPQVVFSKSIGFDSAPYYETNEDGLDVLPEFETDDGELFRQGFETLKSKAGTAAKAAGAAATKAIDTANQKIEEGRTDTPPTPNRDEGEET